MINKILGKYYFDRASPFLRFIFYDYNNCKQFILANILILQYYLFRYFSAGFKKYICLFSHLNNLEKKNMYDNFSRIILGVILS